MQQNNNISVIINTLNEEKNIKDCLLSVAWANEIILVDMHSDDHTVQIAKQFANVKVFYHERLGYADPARKFALEQVTNNWVIMLDADERINLATAKMIPIIINQANYDVVYLRRYNYFIGTMIETNIKCAEYLPRLFKKSCMAYVAQVHNFEQVSTNARVFYLKEQNNIGIVHFAYSSVDGLLNKINRYSTIEADNIFDNSKKPLKLWKIMLRYPYHLLKDLFYYKNYKPWPVQFYMTTAHFFYELSSYIKFYYMKKYDSKIYINLIDGCYRSINDKLIREYMIDSVYGDKIKSYEKI